MNFSLNDEQSMLKESVVQYIDKSYEFEDRMNVVESPEPYSAEKWQEFAELGWLSLPFSTDDDGFGGGTVELMLMMEELGRGLVIEPYLAAIVMAGGCIKRSDNAALRQRLLPLVMSGETVPALAYAERGSRYTLNHVETTAQADGDDFVINGEKFVVFNGATADQIVVVARTSGAFADDTGITLFCVDAESHGITRQGFTNVDGSHAAHITFDNVRVTKDEAVSAIGEGLAMLESVVLEATLAVCAEAIGIMDALTTKTVEYTKDRKQFGLPLSSFQALQHRMVDMFMELEQSRSLLLRAAIRLDEGDPQAPAAVAALKYYIGTAGRKLGEEAVQLHGGMGVTNELDVAHLFKRLTVIDTLFGNSDYQLNRYIDAM
ncbi:MAG: acyl-CoA dehydrogenase family protein [Gammaproteobacteria bacterium]